MATDKADLRADTLTYAALCREDTGAHMCDSGGAYGRIYDRPPVEEGLAQLISCWGSKGEPPTMSTAAYLSEMFPIDHGLQGQWEEFDGAHEDLNWFESAEEFMKSRGYVRLAKDNTYNGESDLDQCFVWSVWAKPDPDKHGWGEAVDGVWLYDREWWYLDDLVTVIHVHTGCDVRGGYSRPAFNTRSDWEGVLCHGFCFGYRAESGTRADGTALDPDELDGIMERWSTGYSDCPWYQMKNEIEEFLTGPVFGDEGYWFIVAGDKYGRTLRIVPEAALW